MIVIKCIKYIVETVLIAHEEGSPVAIRPERLEKNNSCARKGCAVSGCPKKTIERAAQRR